jgi:hypothetical protein
MRCVPRRFKLDTLCRILEQRPSIGSTDRVRSDTFQRLPQPGVWNQSRPCLFGCRDDIIRADCIGAAMGSIGVLLTLCDERSERCQVSAVLGYTSRLWR